MGTVSRTDRVFGRYQNIGATTTSDTEPALPSPSYTYFDLSSSRTDGGPVPEFKRKIAQGLNATSSLSGERRTLTLQFGGAAAYYTFGSPGSLSYQWTVRQGDLIGGFVPNGIAVDMTPAVNEAKRKFVKACLQEMQALEGQVFLGELAQTLHMIKNPAKALRESLDFYFGKMKKYRKLPKRVRSRVVADSWLEYQFGVRPLISDIEDGISALNRFSQRRDRWRPVTASGKIELSHDLIPLQTNAGVFLYTTERRRTVSVSYRIQGAVNLQTGGRDAVLSDLGLRFDRFVPTLWEIVPYSFLVDYFSNIGDIVSSWAFGTKHVRWAYGSSRVATRFEYYVNEYRPAPDRDVTFVRTEPCKLIGTHVIVDRSPSIDSLVPSFRLEIPGASSLKWLNLAALARSRKSLTPF